MAVTEVTELAKAPDGCFDLVDARWSGEFCQFSGLI